MKSADVDPLVRWYERRNEFFFKPSLLLQCVLIALFVFGSSYFVYSFSTDPKRAWGALLCNNLFFFLLSLGGLVFGLIQDACGAEWSRPIKRYHETFAVFFYVSSLIFLVVLTAIKLDFMQAREVYSWIANPHILDHFPGKNQWLVEDFFLVRVVGYLILMAAVVWWAQWQIYLPDKTFLAGNLGDTRRLAQRASDRLRFWSSPCLFFLGVIFSGFVIDVYMSLAPLWFSTLWAGWLFATLIQILLCVTALTMFVVKKTSAGSLISQSQFHDIGKLLHGFSAFWAYLTYAHVLTYWYGNVPEETEYFLHRLHEPWQTMMVITALCAFVVPFIVLIPKAAKWTWWVMVPLSCLILAAQWLAHVVIVQPQIVTHDQADKLFFPGVEIAGFIAFSSLFVWCFYLWGRRHLMVSLHDPMLHKYLTS
ncbi:MAG: hypothetical protein OXC40_05980, partial [Proteobacteria bacterium]|nr:hypothetical protein [Pseudomonadota bacterium]